MAVMNDECLLLRGQTAGHQMPEEIRHIVDLAMGQVAEFDLSDEELTEQVGVHLYLIACLTCETRAAGVPFFDRTQS